MKWFKKFFGKKPSNNFTGFEICFYLKGKLMTQHIALAGDTFYCDFNPFVRLPDNELILGYKLESKIIVYR